MGALAQHFGAPTLSSVGTKDEERADIKARRERLGMSQRALEKESGINRATIASAERGGNVNSSSVRSIQAALDRIEREISGPYDTAEQVTNTMELPDGTRVTFVGSPSNVAEAAARFLAQHKD